MMSNLQASVLVLCIVSTIAPVSWLIVNTHHVVERPEIYKHAALEDDWVFVYMFMATNIVRVVLPEIQLSAYRTFMGLFVMSILGQTMSFFVVEHSTFLVVTGLLCGSAFGTGWNTLHRALSVLGPNIRAGVIPASMGIMMLLLYNIPQLYILCFFCSVGGLVLTTIVPHKDLTDIVTVSVYSFNPAPIPSEVADETTCFDHVSVGAMSSCMKLISVNIAAYESVKAIFLSFIVCRLNEVLRSGWDVVHAMVVFSIVNSVSRIAVRAIHSFSPQSETIIIAFTTVGLAMGNVFVCMMSTDIQMHWVLTIIAIFLGGDEIVHERVRGLIVRARAPLQAAITTQLYFAIMFIAVCRGLYPNLPSNGGGDSDDDPESSVSVMLIGTMICIFINLGACVVYSIVRPGTSIVNVYDVSSNNDNNNNIKLSVYNNNNDTDRLLLDVHPVDTLLEETTDDVFLANQHIENRNRNNNDDDDDDDDDGGKDN